MNRDELIDIACELRAARWMLADPYSSTPAVIQERLEKLNRRLFDLAKSLPGEE